MKILKITTLYADYIKSFYNNNPQLKTMLYKEQQASLFYDGFGWADFYSVAMNKLGYEMIEVLMNVEYLQRAWAREAGILHWKKENLKQIVVYQVRKFKPDILWFDNFDEELLRVILESVPSIRLVIGCVGSAIPKTSVWRYVDIILSCAPEAVNYLRKNGLHAEHLDHGFDPRINERIKEEVKNIELLFIGQIIRGNQFHFQRERLLNELCSKINVQINSSAADISLLDDIEWALKINAYKITRGLKTLGISESILRSIPLVRKVICWEGKPLRKCDPKLSRFIKSAIYGLEMFQTIRNSKISLNIHADSSPQYASNMRLFEATGVGTCLITDWKENIGKLFEEGKEVVTYRSVEECIEKVRWLLEHPSAREAIAKAGQARTLKNHNFYNRSERLDILIKKKMKLS